MGSIIERARKDGVTYQAMVKVPGAKAACRSFATRESAQRFVDEVESERKAAAELMRGKRARPRSVENIEDENRLLFSEEWLRETLRLHAASGEMSAHGRRCLPTVLEFMGDPKNKELRRGWVKRYIADARRRKTRTGRPFAWSTILGHLKVIDVALKWRCEDLDIPRVKLPVSTDLLPDGWEVRRERRLLPGEEQRIWARLRSSRKPSKRHWLRLFRLALETGARLQELVLAEWDEFSMDGKFWTIPAAHTKTKATRVVPLTKAALRALKAMRLISAPDSSRVFHAMGAPRCVSCVFHVMMNKIGLHGFRFHDLRHEAISRMVNKQRNLSVFEIMGAVGHSTTAMLKRYANLRGDELAKKLI